MRIDTQCLRDVAIKAEGRKRAWPNWRGSSGDEQCRRRRLPGAKLGSERHHRTGHPLALISPFPSTPTAECPASKRRLARLSIDMGMRRDRTKAALGRTAHEQEHRDRCKEGREHSGLARGRHAGTLDSLRQTEQAGLDSHRPVTPPQCRVSVHEAVAIARKAVDAGHHSLARAFALEMDDDIETSAEQRVDGDSVESGGEAECLDPRRHIVSRVRVDRAAPTRVAGVER